MTLAVCAASEIINSQQPTIYNNISDFIITCYCNGLRRRDSSPI